MSATELTELAIAPAETDADLEAMIHVRRLVTPEARPTVENLRFNLDRNERLVYLVARVGGEPVACGFVQPLDETRRRRHRRRPGTPAPRGRAPRCSPGSPRGRGGRQGRAARRGEGER